MGRSSGYCFRIIACGSNSESVDRDALDTSAENKGSDKRGWSFRKRSAGHRVLSNTVITEISSTVNKSSEPAIINSEAPIDSSVSEKTSANQLTEELPQVTASTSEDRTESHLVIEAADEDEIKMDSSIDESIIIVIQAAVRKFLAQRELARHKSVVTLQAAVRGHLVRCRAAGALRCIQAIIKMQALVRVRHANISVEKASTGNEGVQVSKTKPHPTYISIEKLLSNRFAIQLLESTPRTKQINIKCSPSSNDLAWKWMERWTSVSSPQPDKAIDTELQSENIILEQMPDFYSDESKHLNTRSEAGPATLPGKHLPEAEQPKRPAKRVATEQADSEGRKSVFGSRKASNPTFIAAHSKFEELTSKNNSLTSRESLGYESLKVGQSPTVGSECGTELSVTSMLDSPDLSEAGNVGYEKAKVSDIESTELTHPSLDSQVKQSHEDDSSNADIELEPVTGRQLYKSPIHKSSPEASPRSHITASEPHETPSSQIDNRKTKTDRKTSSQKSKSNSKKSPVSSGLRTSFDHLPGEIKPGKRRNSFGSQSSDQEPRDSSCSNSIPSYMQVTESARAKAVANNSPKSSPDVQSKETYMKRRHSGSGNGRHGSPSVKRNSPQAPQTAKGNNIPERKWQR